jgi:hypothetical protein
MRSSVCSIPLYDLVHVANMSLWLRPFADEDNESVMKRLNLRKLRRDSDKSLAFPIFLFLAQPKEFFLDGLKKLEQRSRKCVELRGECVE